VKTRGFAHRIDIAAPPPRVWTVLCGPTLLSQWLGPDAVIRPQKDGTLAATVAPGFRREAVIDVFDPPRRLRLIYMVPPDLPAFDGAVVEDFMLEPMGRHTVLRLLCSGVPDNPDWMGHFQKLRMVSERLLGRLRALCEQREQAAAQASAGNSPA
jgi:uncharacterized protein YndB with AHSA1/START domain